MANDKIIDEIAPYGDRINHIAFIMDGNGRWASRRGLPRTAGHAAGATAFRRVVQHCAGRGLKHLTFYAFSTENWSRPKEEVDRIMELLADFTAEAKRIHKKYGLRVIFIGDRKKLSENLLKKMTELEEMSKGGVRTLNVAFNYGAREEIVSAVNALIAEGKSRVTEQDICSHLYTSLSPDPDLIIRTAGELRLSNFLLWQAAYSEFWFTDKLWPDITGDDVDAAVKDFLGRKRKFGGLDTSGT